MKHQIFALILSIITLCNLAFSQDIKKSDIHNDTFKSYNIKNENINPQQLKLITEYLLQLKSLKEAQIDGYIFNKDIKMKADPPDRYPTGISPENITNPAERGIYEIAIKDNEEVWKIYKQQVQIRNNIRQHIKALKLLINDPSVNPLFIKQVIHDIFGENSKYDEIKKQLLD